MKQEYFVPRAYSPKSPGKTLILILCILVFILNMDITIVNMALPSLSSLPDSTDNKLQWVVASYALAASVAVIPSGALLDHYGSRWVIAGASILFGAGSLVASLSPNMTILIISRVSMGLGSSAILTGSIAVLTLYYQDEQKARAFGIWSACAAVGLCAGPLIGGWILSVTSWGIIFLINVPLSVLAGIFVAYKIPTVKDLNRDKIDIISISVLSVVLVAGIAGLIEFGAGRVSLTIALGTVCLATFVLFLMRQQNPKTQILNPSMLKSGDMIMPLSVLVVLFMVMAIILFLVPSSFELGMQRGSFLSSLYVLPLPFAIAIATLCGGYILHTLAVPVNLCISLTAVAIGLLLLLSQNPANPSSITIAGLACIGLGVGIGQPVALQAAVGSFDPEQRGIGSGVVNSIRLAANAAGVAIAGGVLSLTMTGGDFADTTNNLVKGASSCGGLVSVEKLKEASELCTVYMNGVKIVFLLSLVMVLILLVVVSTWGLQSRKARMRDTSLSKALD